MHFAMAYFGGAKCGVVHPHDSKDLGSVVVVAAVPRMVASRELGFVPDKIPSRPCVWTTSTSLEMCVCTIKSKKSIARMLSR